MKLFRATCTIYLTASQLPLAVQTTSPKIPKNSINISRSMCIPLWAQKTSKPFNIKVSNQKQEWNSNRQQKSTLKTCLNYSIKLENVSVSQMMWWEDEAFSHEWEQNLMTKRCCSPNNPDWRHLSVEWANQTHNKIAVSNGSHSGVVTTVAALAS